MKMNAFKVSLITSASILVVVVSTTAFAGSNQAYIDQIGNTHVANVTQTGDSNKVASSTHRGVQNWYRYPPNGGLTTGNNKLTITQTGDTNTVGAGQYGELSQYGGTHVANITQTGNTNDLGGFVQTEGTGDDATVKQLGNQNYIKSVSQHGTSDKATVIQSGNGNGVHFGVARPTGGSAYINLKSWVDAQLYQQGNAHIADYEVTGNGNLFWIVQGGNKTLSTGNLLEYKSTGSGNNNNYLEAEQYGTDNSIRNTVMGSGNVLAVRQGAGAAWDNVSASYFHNSMTWEQYGDNHWAEVSQMGAWNDVSGFQMGGNGNQLYAAQNGNSNKLVAEQNGGSNFVDSLQGGNGNLADVTQGGQSNVAIIRQGS
jgi:hypothetical protein